jgi:FdrA protein
MIETITVVPGRYYDSVRLMQVSRDVGSVPGIEQALVAMATELNLGLLEEMGFAADETSAAGPDDLIVAVRAVDGAAMTAARAVADEALQGPAAAEATGLFVPPSPRTVGSAARRSGANLALVSVPGPHAFVEGMDALRQGLHVMVFSDNVSVTHEVRLKQEAAKRGLLMMGPDCGTAIVNGVGLGFANSVDPGPVGVTGASGTGIQQLCSLLDAAGIGVRHALGTGSRDLSAAVKAMSTLTALAALDADTAVEVIVVVSKPADLAVTEAVRDAIHECTTPVVTALLGTERVTLDTAAAEALAVLGSPAVEAPAWQPDSVPPPRSGVLRGLFSGGTLCAEARMLAELTLGEVMVDASHGGHRLVDYGADIYTRGRAHPMIDPSLRLRDMTAAAADPATSVLLIDIVLGYGAHPDPAAETAPVIRNAVAAGVPVVVSLCGTRRDPQGLDRQAEALVASGAEVFVSNAAAAQRAARFVEEANA